MNILYNLNVYLLDLSWIEKIFFVEKMIFLLKNTLEYQKKICYIDNEIKNYL